MYEFHSVEELLAKAVDLHMPISEVVLHRQMEDSQEAKEAIMERMRKSLREMRRSAASGCDKDIRSTSRLSGGNAYILDKKIKESGSLLGPVLGRAAVHAMAIAEYNACMGRIVACPTAGSCGIVPAALLAMLDEEMVNEDQAVMGLFCAGGIGMMIARGATLSGAEGGCQAECGSAAAMAAAAVTELCGGTPGMCADAAAITLKSMLGLVCDPVAGLVEIPCIKRNVSGAMIAFSSAQMALAGIPSMIPLGDVISAMKEVGSAMPLCYRETASGGLATTRTGKKLNEKLRKEGHDVSGR